MELSSKKLRKVKILIEKLAILFNISEEQMLDAMTEGIEHSEYISDENWDSVQDEFQF